MPYFWLKPYDFLTEFLASNIMHRQALLDIQEAVLLPEAMDTEAVLQHAKELEVLDEQTEPSPEPMVRDIANDKEVDE